MSRLELEVRIVFVEQLDMMNGAVFLKGDSTRSGFEKVLIYLSTKPLELFASMPGDEFCSKLELLAEKGTSHRLDHTYQTVHRYFSQNYPQTKYKRIFDSIAQSEDDGLRNAVLSRFFLDDLTGLLKSTQIDHELASDCSGSGISSSVKKEVEHSEDEGFKPSLDAIVLSTSPVIDPSSGIRACDLKNGDRIIVKITDHSPIGWHVARSITCTSEPSETEVQATILNIEKKTVQKNVEASEVINVYTCFFDESVLGNFEAPMDLLIKQEKKRTFPEDEGEQTQFKMDRRTFALVYSGALLVLVIILIAFATTFSGVDPVVFP